MASRGALVRTLAMRELSGAYRRSRLAARTPGQPREVEARLATLTRYIAMRFHAFAVAQLEGILGRAEAAAKRADAEDDFEGEEAEVRRVLARIRKVADRYASALGYEMELAAIARQLDDWSRQDVARYLAIDVNAVAPDPAALREFRRATARLIKDIPIQQAERIANLVTQAQTTGMRVETLQKRLQAEEGIAKRRAELIARDQVLKANAKLNEDRQKEVGVERYIWSAGADDRVRPMHRDLDGKTFRWDDPPITNPQGDRNHPGQDYQCRCGAIPLMPGDEEADDITRRAMAAIRGVA